LEPHGIVTEWRWSVDPCSARGRLPRFVDPVSGVRLSRNTRFANGVAAAAVGTTAGPRVNVASTAGWLGIGGSVFFQKCSAREAGA
jgi:hypothetical protein